MRKIHSTPSHSFSIGHTLRALRATGWSGFEGLVATLLTGLTDHSLLLASSGLQSGLDSRTSHKSDVLIAVECKRYHEDKPLSQRELLGEINAAVTAHPQLDCWILAATRPISAQEESTLEAECRARGIEYLSLGCATLPNIGLLDALCASQAARALEYLKAACAGEAQIEAFEQATQYIASRAETAVRVEELRRQLSVASLGFSVFRDNLNRRLSDDLADVIRCKHRFRCSLGSHALPKGVTTVPRPAFRTRLHDLWADANNSTDHRAVVILGEEGDGKSWVVADWITDLISTPDAPAVFFIAAREPSSSIVDTLSSHACDYANIKSASAARPVLDRWLHTVGQRRAVVVFDGLNERLDQTLWSDLVADALQEYGTSIFLVLTCRRQTWQATYRPVMLYQPTELTIGPFDDHEFARALSLLPVQSRSSLIELGPLVRRPRYFHCACEHALKLGSTHELSIPLLYYLDWQHRQSRRPLLGLSTDNFELGLMELAERELQASRTFASRQTGSIETLRDHEFLGHLEELSSGGVLRRSGPLRRWQVEKPFLALGLGMYLASLLEETGGNIDERCELASATLGDTSSWDLTGDVMQQALQHALHTSPAFSVETQIALFTVWTQCLNGLDQAANVLPQLALLQPELVFGYADRAWRTSSSDNLIEIAVLKALIRVSRSRAHQNIATAWLCRWVGAVHQFGEDTRDDEDPAIHRYVDVDRLCGGRDCILQSSGVLLRREEQRFGIRLGRLALAVLSACDRRVYWQALVTALVANEAMGGTRSDVLAWIIRSSAQPLDDLADATVTTLLDDRDRVSDRAARKLLKLLGSPALMHRLPKIPPDPSPQRRPFQDEYDADPCGCFFIAPPRGALIGCLSRIDVPYHINAGRAEYLAADLDVEFPALFADRVRDYAKTLDVNRLRLQMGTDSEDVKWRDVEPLLCRIDPNLFADIIRRFAMTATTREGLALRQLSWSIEEYTDLLGPGEVAALRAAWQRHSAVLQSDANSPDDLFVEAMLAEAILPHLTADTQYAFLLARPPSSHEVLSMENTFKHLSPTEQVQRMAPRMGDPHNVRVALWFLRAQPEINLDVAVRLITEAMCSKDSGARGFGLALLQRIERARWPDIGGLDTWTDSSTAWVSERFYGTLMVMQATLPSAESLARCSKAHMGAVLAILDGSQADQWSKCYADLMMRALRRLASEAPTIPEYPAIEISAGKRHPWHRISLSRRPSTEVKFVAPMFSWGGLEPGGAEAFASVFQHDDQDGALNDLLNAALDAATEQGDWLFASLIPQEAIARIIQAQPSFIDEFDEVLGQAEAGRRIGRIQAVVEAMTAWGLRSGIVAAECWLDSLESASLHTNFKDALTGLSSRQAALLAAPASPSIETRWRSEMDHARSDHELYQIIYTLDSNGHRHWLLDEAAAHQKSGAPRGRALCISILAALTDDGQSLAELLPTLLVPPSSWYSELSELAQHYARGGKDYRRWLREAVSHDDAVLRVRAARLARHIEDGRAPLIRSQLFDDSTLSEAPRLRLHQPRLLRERNSRSQWAKNLDERLFGMKQLGHEVAPWLPIAKILQLQ